MQFRDAQRFFRKVDAGDAGALRSHRFGENAAAATDIEYVLVAQSAAALVDVVAAAAD